MPPLTNDQPRPKYYWDTEEARAKLDLIRVQQQITEMSEEEIARCVLAISKTSLMSQEAQKERKKKTKAEEKALLKAAREYLKTQQTTTQGGDTNT